LRQLCREPLCAGRKHAVANRLGDPRPHRVRRAEFASCPARCSISFGYANQRWLLAGRSRDRNWLPEGFLSDLSSLSPLFPPAGARHFSRAAVVARHKRRDESGPGSHECSLLNALGTFSILGSLTLPAPIRHIAHK